MDLCQNLTGGSRENIRFKCPKRGSTSVSKALCCLEVYFHVKEAVNRTKSQALHRTVVYSLPGMNNKKAGTVLWGVCGCVYTHLRACVTESPEQLK